MTYLGTLKTWIYWALLSFLPANVWTIRLPMVLAGAVSVFVFFKLSDLAIGRRGAIIAALLLTLDPMFLLTSTFDWGPVALEHLLLVTACFCLFCFGAQYDWRAAPGEPIWHSLLRGRDRFLAVGFLLLGVGMWNKAIFAWALAGLTLAAAIALWPFVGRELRLRTLGIAAVAFLVGASPLIVYNLQQAGVTVGENANFDPSEIATKWLQVRGALNGSSLYGYITADAPARRESGMYYVMGALLLLVPLWWRSRAAWFSLIFCMVSWLLMATTKGAGTAAHHTILLWPFPVLFAAVVLARLPKYIGMAATIGIAVLQLLVLHQHMLEFQQRGTGPAWTDAIFPLSDELKTAGDKTVYITDWGILEPVHLLEKGSLRLAGASGPLMADSPSSIDIEVFGRMMADPSGIFVGHVREHEVFPDVGKHSDALAARAGKQRKVLRTIVDSHGRPMFEISTFQ